MGNRVVTAAIAIALAGGSALAGQVPFGPQQIVAGSATDASWVEAADIDRDGRLDFVYAVEGQNKIAWRRNTDGQGTPGPELAINAAANTPYSLAVGDIDRDGDLDVIYASRAGNKIAWHSNTNGLGAFSGEIAIPGTPMSCRRVKLADLDRDGDLDALSASDADGVIAWYPNNGAGIFGAQQVINAAAAGTFDVEAADFDRDGDLDVVYPAGGVNAILWQVNNGAGTFGAPMLVPNSVNVPRDVEAADLGGFALASVASASFNDNKISTRSSDGFGGFFGESVVTTLATQATTVRAADLDGDGDLDLFSAGDGDDVVAWYENDFGFGPKQPLAPAPDVHCITPADLDGDGDVDLLYASKAGNFIAWQRNFLIHRSAAFGPERQLGSPSENPSSIYAADLDREGDLDLVVVNGPAGVIYWYCNTDGQGTFLATSTITTAVDSPTFAATEDLDRDGDPDIAYATSGDNKVAWQPNADGFGNFGAQQVLPVAVNSGQSIAVADIDRNGTPDAVSTSMNTSKIAWNANNGVGVFAAETNVAAGFAGARGLCLGDLDRDGDIDAVGAAFNGNLVQLFRNTNGAGLFGAGTNVTSSVSQPIDVAAADIDRDGDLDVVSASVGDDKFAWHPNDGAGNFGAQQAMTLAADGARSVRLVDLDNDGDLDALEGSGLDARVAWQENANGAGGFAAPLAINQGAAPENVFVNAADLDGDTDMDVLYTLESTGEAGWHENCGGHYAIAASSVAPATAPEYGRAAALRLDMIHRGRAGDTDEELMQLDLRIEDGAGVPLTNPQANALIDSLYVYLDDGSGAFEQGLDTEVASVGSPLFLAGGELLVTFADGDPNVRVAFGSPKTFFIVAQIAPGAPSQSPNSFRIVQLEELTFAEDADYDILLDQECRAQVDFPSTVITTVAGPTPTPTVTETATPTETPTPTLTPSGTASRTPSQSPSRTASQSPSRSPSQSPTPTSSISRTPSPSPSSSFSPTLSLSRSPSASPSASASRTPSLSQSQSPSPSASPSASPSQTASRTPSPTPSPSASASPSPSISSSATASQTPSRTPSASASRTASASPSASPSQTPSRSPSLTASPTPSSSPSATASLTATPSPTESITPTASLSPTPNAAANWEIYE